MTDLAKIEIELLTIDTPEKFLAVRQKLDVAKGIIKTLETLLNERGLEIIEATGPIDGGEVIYRIATDTTYKPVMKPTQMAQEILAALAGDWDAFSACLASGAFKPGQLRTLLEESGAPEKFRQFFERVEKKTVDGSPVKKVGAVSKLFSSAR